MHPPSPQTNTAHGRWTANLEIEVLRSGDRCVLGRRRHLGPLRVQRPFYPEGHDCPHVYVLHPPGGLVGGDELDIDVRVRAGANALFTTPAAQKIYRVAEHTSIQRANLVVEERGALEWFPSETIAFAGARAQSTTRVHLDDSAAFLGWELVCLGRPAGDKRFDTGELGLAFELYRFGMPLCIDRSRLAGGALLLAAPWGCDGMPVFGSFYVVPRDKAEIDRLVTLLREHLGDTPRAAVTGLDELVVLRALAHSAEALRSLFVRAWAGVRPLMVGRVAAQPRIWAV